MTTTVTVEIPADVRDNSETVTDYAHMSHRAPDKGVRTVHYRETDLILAHTFGYTAYEWDDVNPDGQRCRFHMITKPDGTVRHLYHTEYFTRTACAECAYSYAVVFQVITTDEMASDPVPRCGEHADRFRHAVAGTPGLVLTESEPLRIGQHS